MSETTVLVTTLAQWNSVLSVWFRKGYSWPGGDKDYSENLFKNGGRFLFLDDDITYSHSNYDSNPFIEYPEFIAKQKEDKEVKTYYVTKERLNTIEVLKNKNFPLNGLLNKPGVPLSYGLNSEEEKALLRYLGGDETIEFKVKEPLYRLWATDQYGDKVYFSLGGSIWGRTATVNVDVVFTAPLEEIKKWQTPDWKIEKAD